MSQLLKPMIEANGLNTLILIVQLELAKEAAQDANVKVSPNEMKAEREATLGKMFRQNDEKVQEDVDKALRAGKPELAEKLRKAGEGDRDRFLKQFLDQSHISASELEIVLETNAYLRKVAEPHVQKQITDEVLRKEFAIRYNEQARVRHIQFGKPQDAAIAMGRLKAGEPFEKVASEMSTNQRTRALKGEFPLFSRENPDLPKNFIDAAFALKPGEVSEMVSTGDTYHLIKLEETILPQLVKFEDVRDSLFKDLMDRTITSVMGEIRDNIHKVVIDSLQIDQPVLAAQFAAKKEEASTKANNDRLLLEQQRDALRATVTTQPSATRPATARAVPAPPAKTQPVVPSPAMTQPAAKMPTATMPAATTRSVPAPAISAPAPPATQPASATRPVSASTRPTGVQN